MELTIVLASGERRSVALDGHEATIGRLADCEISVDSPAVSRRHARLSHNASGQWTIEDLGSLNGIEVNGKPVNTWMLREGDEITLGDARIFVGAAPQRDSTIIVRRPHAGAGLWLDSDARCLRQGEQQRGRQLAELEFRLLKLLADANGHVVERRRIEETVWGANAYDDNALHQLVRRTREKIGDDTSAPRILLTLPSVGYRLDLMADLSGQ
jgi:DNA-binding winged helix-turn-helix (wHTH) protein